MDVLRACLVLVHAGATAAWLGGMLYSITVVQPKLMRFFADPSEREDFATVLASGARWKVLGLAAVLGLSGIALTAIELGETEATSDAWAALVVLKGGLLAVAVALFIYVSWRLWPQRLLAHMSGSPDLARIQARFRWIAIALTALIAAGFVAGVLAESTGP